MYTIFSWDMRWRRARIITRIESNDDITLIPFHPTILHATSFSFHQYACNSFSSHYYACNILFILPICMHFLFIPLLCIQHPFHPTNMHATFHSSHYYACNIPFIPLLIPFPHLIHPIPHNHHINIFYLCN